MTVFGQPVDRATRCVHYASELDIVAVKFKCCGRYYPCHRCHDEAVDHPTQVWPREEFDRRAVLCGNCRSELTIHAYLDAGEYCPCCRAPFNPRCREHRHLYFDV